jgi:hypothetical protein
MATTARLAERVDAFVFPSDQAAERARNAGTTLHRQAEELAGTVADAAERLEASASGLGTRMADALAAVNATAERAERTRGALETAVGNIERLASAIGSHAGSIEKSAGRDLAAATDRLAGQVAVVEAVVEAAVAHLHDGFTQQLGRLNAARNAVATQVNEIRSLLQQQSQELARSSETAVQRSTQVGDAFREHSRLL